MYQLTLGQLLIVYLSLSVNGNQYERKLTKLWSISNVKSVIPRTAVVNVTTGSLSVEPTSYTNGGVRSSRQAKMPVYAFKPRTTPMNRRDEPSQVERSLHYVEEPKQKQKTDILFPGNYFKISEVKREENNTDGTTFNPLQGGPFHPKIIPLIRNQFRRRSMDDDEPALEKPDGYTEPTAMRRSISYLFGEDAEEDDDEDDDDIEIDVKDVDDKDADSRRKVRKKRFRIKKKYARYMLPLLLAYKLKFFAMIPLLMGGLVLLVGATGLAGFFFALFAAVMGLQKGSY